MRGKMGLAMLREANVKRQAEWDPGSQIDLAYRGNELAGEVGEACNVLKKLHREMLGIVGSRAKMTDAVEEVSDVVICTDLIAMSIDIPIEEYQIDTVQPNVSLSVYGVRLCVAAGMLCRMIDSGMDVVTPGSVYRRTIGSTLTSVVFACRKISMAVGFDLYDAVRDKFNRTSEKYSLGTRIFQDPVTLENYVGNFWDGRERL